MSSEQAKAILKLLSTAKYGEGTSFLAIFAQKDVFRRKKTFDVDFKVVQSAKFKATYTVPRCILQPLIVTLQASRILELIMKWKQSVQQANLRALPEKLYEISSNRNKMTKIAVFPFSAGIAMFLR